MAQVEGVLLAGGCCCGGMGLEWGCHAKRFRLSLCGGIGLRKSRESPCHSRRTTRDGGLRQPDGVPAPRRTRVGPPNMPAAMGDVAVLVARLQALSPGDTGSSAWWAQCTSLERLNAAVHAAGAGGNGGSTAAAVVGAFTAAPQQLEVLVHTLLVAEAWRERVLPHLGAQAGSSAHCCCRSVLLAVAHASLVVQSPPDRLRSCAATWRATTRRWWPTCWRRCCLKTPSSRRRQRTRCLSWPTTALGRHVGPGAVSGTRSPLFTHTSPASVIHCAAGVPDHREAQRAARGSVRSHIHLSKSHSRADPSAAVPLPRRWLQPTGTAAARMRG